MSGTVDLTSLFTSAVGTSTTSTLLDIITGKSSSASTTNPIVALKEAEADETKDVAQTEKEPTVARDIAQFTAAVNSATSVKQLLSNPAFQKVFLTANGLSDQIGYTALVTKALMSDPSSSTSLVSQLGDSDSSWTSTAKAYDFSSQGLSVIQSSTAISSITEGYAEITWRNSLDTTTPGLSNALTFRSEASTITSVDQILGDSVMRDVVTTALGIPEQIAVQPLEAQEKAISSRLDVSKLKNPTFVDQFVALYLNNKAQASSTTSSNGSGLIQLAAQSEGLTV